MANFDLEKRRSSEAAMKMIISSAFSSGFYCLVFHWFMAATGTLNFAELPAQFEW